MKPSRFFQSLMFVLFVAFSVAAQQPVQVSPIPSAGFAGLDQ